MQLRGRVAIVTGAGHGLGRALAEGLAAAGAYVALVDRDGAAARAVAQGLPGDTFGTTADVAHPEALARLVAHVEQRLGPIDVYCSVGARADVRTHRLAAAEVLPTMAQRHRGYFLAGEGAAPGVAELVRGLAAEYAGAGVVVEGPVDAGAARAVLGRMARVWAPTGP